MSFRKRTAKPAAQGKAAIPTPPTGVRTSTTSGAAVTSWGIHGLDLALGSGLPLSTLTGVIEDEPTAYHTPLCSYVTAQGVHSGHAVAVCAFDRPAGEVLETLPMRVDRTVGAPGAPREQARMQIAWRYQKHADRSVHVVSGDAAGAFALDFDLSQTAPLPRDARVSRVGRGESESLDEVLKQLRLHCEMSATQKVLARIVVHGLSTAVVGGRKDPVEAISAFLSGVRALTRVFGAVAVVSCARDVPQRVVAVAVDALLKIDSFDGRGAGVAGLGKEWLGVLIVKKTFRDERGVSLRGKGDVWVFKRGRRKYTMERATAAPDEEDEPAVVSEPKDSGTSGGHFGSASASGGSTSVLCGVKPSSSGMDF